MVDLPEIVLKLVKIPGSHKVASTVSPSGEPHAIICMSLYTKGSDIILLPDVFMKRTDENIKNNPNVEFVVWHGKEGYSIKTVAEERLTEGFVFDKVKEAMSKYNMTVVAVWSCRVTEVWDESATERAGTRVV